MDALINRKCNLMIIKDKFRDRILQEISSSEVMEMIRSHSEAYMKLMAYYRCAIMEVETKFNVLNEQFSLRYDYNPIESIKTRLKSPDSIAEKMHRKNYPLSVDSIEKNLDDVAGVRVICSFPEDIYLLRDCLLEQDDVHLLEQKDYIKEPKEGGYRSLHLIIEIPIFLEHEKRIMKVEVQLRTIAMDFWASLEHKLRYKKDLPVSDAEALAGDLKACADISASLDYRMESIRNRIEHKQQKITKPTK